jgi:hypothetical protein
MSHHRKKTAVSVFIIYGQILADEIAEREGLNLVGGAKKRAIKNGFGRRVPSLMFEPEPAQSARPTRRTRVANLGSARSGSRLGSTVM